MNNPLYSQIIIKALKTEAMQLGKPLSWFRYATPHKKSGGYRFLAHKEVQIIVLERLAARLHRKLPELAEGQIVDILAEYVNAV
jgi:hypothetical protein